MRIFNNAVSQKWKNMTAYSTLSLDMTNITKNNNNKKMNLFDDIKPTLEIVQINYGEQAVKSAFSRVVLLSKHHCWVLRVLSYSIEKKSQQYHTRSQTLWNPAVLTILRQTSASVHLNTFSCRSTSTASLTEMLHILCLFPFALSSSLSYTGCIIKQRVNMKST